MRNLPIHLKLLHSERLRNLEELDVVNLFQKRPTSLITYEEFYRISVTYWRGGAPTERCGVTVHCPTPSCATLTRGYQRLNPSDF